MRVLAHFLRFFSELRLADIRWALREIDPLHPDVPRLVLKQRELEARINNNRKLS